MYIDSWSIERAVADQSRPTGGATVKSPDSWDDSELGIYYTRTVSPVERAATRHVPSATGTAAPSDKKKSKVGAIAGGVVGGLVGLIAILCLILFCLHRHKKARKNDTQEQGQVTPPPAELPITNPPQEMAAADGGKYDTVRQQLDDNTFATYSEIESQAASQEYKSPLSPYTQHSPHNSTGYNTALVAGTNGQTSSPHSPYENSPASWGQPTPTQQQPHVSPLTPPYTQHSPGQQQQFYPPPQEQHNQYNPPSPDFNRTYEGSQYGGGTDHGWQSQTNTTSAPGQFYSQPLPSSSQTSIPYGQRGVNRANYGDRVDGGRRPVYGRFMEGDHL